MSENEEFLREKFERVFGAPFSERSWRRLGGGVGHPPALVTRCPSQGQAVHSARRECWYPLRTPALRGDRKVHPRSTVLRSGVHSRGACSTARQDGQEWQGYTPFAEPANGPVGSRSSVGAGTRGGAL